MVKNPLIYKNNTTRTCQAYNIFLPSACPNILLLLLLFTRTNCVRTDLYVRNTNQGRMINIFLTP